MWLYLLNMTTDKQMHPPPTLMCLPANSARSMQTLREWEQRGAIRIRKGRGFLSADRRSKLKLEGFRDWLFCNVPCRAVEGRTATGCGMGWPDLR